MGEIADAMIDGEFDYITGEYLGHGVGYPRTREEHRTYRRRKSTRNISWSAETRVVWQFLDQRNINDPFHTKKSEITKAYGKENGWINKVSEICKEVRATKQSWNKFKKWFDTYKN